MKRTAFYIICFTILLIFHLSATAVNAQENSSKKESVWKGFKRIDFQFQNRNARIIFPKKAENGNPWLWRARFPDWHTDADSILVACGFHLVYINTDELLGSPQAMQVWDDFYEHIRSQYSLQQKVALVGVSRGGLYVYNWAKRNPEKVSCIYTEAPVCDFKSWPGGFGKGAGSKEDWELLKKVYDFKNDAEALKYENNPVDNLEALAKAKVPIMHMIGLEDSIVPYAENTKRLVERYLELGGPATVVPCDDYVTGAHGHHFAIETPELVADYIAYHAVDHSKLRSEDFHTFKSGLKNAQLSFQQNKFGRIAFLGGSITYNNGWRDSLMAYFKTKFPQTAFEFINAGIPSMGSTPGAFRLDNDVLSKGKIDLLFVEAAVNDATNEYSNTEQIRAMEGIVRHFKKVNPTGNIVMMHFVDPEKITEYNNGKTPEVISNHNKVAAHYKVPVINLAKEVTERINNDEFTWDNDFKNLHPSPFGQGVYAHSMITFLENAFLKYVNEDDKIETEVLPEKLDADAYDKGYLIEPTQKLSAKSWKYEPNWQPTDNVGTRPNYTNVPMLIGSYPGGVLHYAFSGKAIGIAVAAGPDAGLIEYRVDGGKWQKLNLFTKWSNSLHLPWYFTLSGDLSDKKHILELKMAAEKDERSLGRTCRIRYFYVNGEKL
ncbi:SGNH/GDSL hydrolase family protein [Niabella ginsengisoli]|uniref:GDSL-type esterase/lipase family protein n=1 Tax=Niabella ginsengisoli TaxID=522298 RepID=A0ABS9SDP7_9BACT|nr:SGNH/GDSL hydrolase family protein [Niabella ginsengisoli]MCH5596482.1 GDSL-type esterase/lipase family protein [Niabella ginsengisoli]